MPRNMKPRLLLLSLFLLLSPTLSFSQNMPVIEGNKVYNYFTNHYSKNTTIKGYTDLWATAKGHVVWIVVTFDSKPAEDSISMAVYDDDGEAIAADSRCIGADKCWKLSNGKWCQEIGAFGVLVEDGKKYRVLISNDKLPFMFPTSNGERQPNRNRTTINNNSYPTYYYSGYYNSYASGNVNFNLSIRQTGEYPDNRYQGDLTLGGESIHLDGELECDIQNRVFMVLTSEYGDYAFRLRMDSGNNLSDYSAISAVFSDAISEYPAILRATTKPRNANSGNTQSYERTKKQQHSYLGGVKGWSAERVARAFCEAMYDNDMKRAKSYMTTDGARRTPDSIRGYSDDELNTFKANLARAKYKVIKSDFSDNVVIVRFYNPDYPYLDKRGRWFGCAIQLSKFSGKWEVTDYGY